MKKEHKNENLSIKEIGKNKSRGGIAKHPYIYFQAYFINLVTSR